MNPSTATGTTIPGFERDLARPAGEWIEIDPLCATPALVSAEARGEGGTTLFVKLRGTLTAYTGSLVAERVNKALGAGFQDIVIDYRGVMLGEGYRETLIGRVAGAGSGNETPIVALRPPKDLVELWSADGRLRRVPIVESVDDLLPRKKPAEAQAETEKPEETRERWSKRGWV